MRPLSLVEVNQAILAWSLTNNSLQWQLATLTFRYMTIRYTDISLLWQFANKQFATVATRYTDISLQRHFVTETFRYSTLKLLNKFRGFFLSFTYIFYNFF
jgi:hypothetical protein